MTKTLFLVVWLQICTACGYTVVEQRIGKSSRLCPFVKEQDIAKLRQTLAKGADPNGICDGSELRHHGWGGVKTEPLLVKYSSSLLTLAIEAKNHEIAEILLDAGAYVNKGLAPKGRGLPGALILTQKDIYNFPPICTAAYMNDLQMIELLIQKGASVEGNSVCYPLKTAPSAIHGYLINRLLDQQKSKR